MDGSIGKKAQQRTERLDQEFQRMTGARPIRPVVVLTGASRGLGLALARKLRSKGACRLVLTARESSLPRFKEAGLEEDDSLMLHPLDVASADERLRLVQTVDERFGGADVLVNNAGLMVRAVVEHVTEEDRLRQMEVNYRGPMELARLMLPGMREKRWGRIVNVSSVGGMMAMPTMSVYSASKFALEGASEALSYEVRPWNIRVTLVQPGFINSDGIERVQYTSRSRAAFETPGSAYHQHYKHMASFIGQIMRVVPATPESVASKIMRVIEARRPPVRAAGTFDAWAFGWMRRILPRPLYHELLYHLLPGIKTWGPADPQATGTVPPPASSR